jgi:DNA-binding winged helix-turn-helix (wHTH) protein
VPDPQIVRFGDFVLDLRSGELSKGGRRTVLPHQTFRLLAALIQHRGELVTRDDLRSELWSDDTFVDFERSLNAAVRRLREILDDSAEHPGFIETLPRRGYRFIATVAGESIEHPAEPPIDSVQLLTPTVPPPIHWRPDFRLGALFALAILALATALTLGARAFRERAGPRQEARVVRMTNLGTIRMASISPDGHALAYVRADGARESLWVRTSDDADHRQVVPSVAATFRSVTFAPGERIYYTLFQPDRTHVALYRVPVRGGSPERLSEPTGPVAFSPDGRRFAHVSTTSSFGPGESRVVVADADGSALRVLAVRKPPISFARTKPAWSQDGKWLTVVSGTAGVDVAHELVTIDVADGKELRRMPIALAVIDDLVAPSDDSFVLSGRQSRVLPLQLWRISPSVPALHAVTNDVSDYALAGVMPDGRLVAVRSDTARALWAGELGDLAHARRVAGDSGSLEGFEGLAWTPDGRIVYSAQESGNLDLWTVDPSTAERAEAYVRPGSRLSPERVRRWTHHRVRVESQRDARDLDHVR